MNIVIYGNTTNPEYKKYIETLFKKLAGKGANVFVYAPFYKFWKTQSDIPLQNINLFTTYEQLNGAYDFMLSLGGDGTLLESVKYIRGSGTPVLGINMGRLGFLATISQDEIATSIDNLYNKNYYLEPRSLLKFESGTNPFVDFPFALNDVTVQKMGLSMLTIHAYVNGNLLNSYWADGLIVSTPTGSTAYSLSVGGPIVDPASGNILVSAIAPHNLSIRPVVLKEDVEVKLVVESRGDSFLATVDNRSEIFGPGTTLTLTIASFKVNMLHFNEYNFYNTIRNKLNWGIDKRN